MDKKFMFSCKTYEVISKLFHTFIKLWKVIITWQKFHGYVSGIDVSIDAFVFGSKYMSIGEKFHADSHLWLAAIDNFNGQRFVPSLVIGNNVSFSCFCHVGCVNSVKIGNNVLFGSKCYVTDHNHGFYTGSNISSPDIPPIKRSLTSNQSVIIEDNVWIGDNVVVLPGVRIGYGSIIGANAVVSHDIPEKAIAVGIPARVIKRWNEETRKWEKER